MHITRRHVAVALLVLACTCTPAPRPRNRFGRPVDVDLRGAPVTLVHFWASWCGPCREELPRFVAFAAEHHARVVAITQDRDYESAARYLHRNNIAMETLIDDRGRFAARNHVRIIPTTIAYDANGNVIDRFERSVDWTDPAMARRVIR
ncbi:MAG: TlpA family protein disulfide reductase [Thermoanaerobaculia bacterium]